jgi:Tol biopolymer transport system component
LHTVLYGASTLADLTPDQPLGSPQSDDQPTVSPDGATVVFVRFVDDAQTRGGLFSTPTAGGAPARVIDDAAGVSYPRFAPDGRSILFTMNDEHGDKALWLVAPDGRHPRQLTRFPAGTSAFNGAWSPDGAAITMEVYSRGWSHNELHVMLADGSRDVVLWRGDDATSETAETPDWGR